MALTYEEDIRTENVQQVAERMIIAARTAPKARGIDTLVLTIADREIIGRISEKMKEMARETEAPTFLMRDADNILQAEKVVLLGTRIKSIGLQSCDLCGFVSCEEKDKNPDFPCVFNSNDLGIALGSAVSIAMEARVDNRIMYSVGRAVLRMKLLGEDVKIAFGIPLSVGAKNPFFDRK